MGGKQRKKRAALIKILVILKRHVAQQVWDGIPEDERVRLSRFINGEGQNAQAASGSLHAGGELPYAVDGTLDGLFTPFRH